MTDVHHEATTDAPRAVVDRWFLRRGLPHLIEGYRAREDAATKAVPVLAVVFVAEILLGTNVDFPWWANVGALLGSAAIALGGLAAVNRLRGRRPLQRPDGIGVPEVAVFVLVPPLMPLVFGQQVLQAVEVLAFNVALLAVAFAVTGYAIVPMVRWAFGQVAAQLGDLGNLVIRSLPLLLLFSMFLFFNAELWKIMDDLPTLQWWASVVLLVAIGSAFVALRIPRELAEVGAFGSWDDVRAVCAGTEVDDVLVADGWPAPVPSEDDGEPSAPPLDRTGRVNVGLVAFVAQATQIALVTLVIFGFYVLFGLLTIIPSTIEQWTGSADLQQVAAVQVLGLDVRLTVELLRTAAFIATVSGLQFTVAALTDGTYRAEFREETVGDVRQAFAVRSLYLARLRPTTRSGHLSRRPPMR